MPAAQHRSQPGRTAESVQRSKARRSTREFWLAFAACLLVATLLLGGALAPGRVLSPADVLLSDAVFGRSGYQDFEPTNRLLTDVTFAFEPWLIEARRQLVQGHWPFLNPYAGLYAPLFGNFQSALLSPFNWPFLLTGSPRSFAVAAYLKLLTAGLGAWYLARLLRLRPPYALLCGAWYMLAGFVVLWLLYPLANVAVLFPWLTVLTVRVVRAPSSRTVAGLAAVTAFVWLGGHPETAVHSALGAVFFALGSLSGCRRHGPSCPKRLGALAAGLGLGTVTAMPVFCSFGDYFVESQALSQRFRERAWRPLRTGVQTGLASAVTWIVPYAFGSYARGDVHIERALGVENFNETASGYTSVAGVALFLAGFLVWPRRAWVRIALVLSAAGWLLGYKIYPLYDLVQSLPVVGAFQNQRLLLWPCLFGPLVAAHLLQTRAWGRLRGPTRWLPVAPVVGAALVSFAVAFALPGLRESVDRRIQAHAEKLVQEGRVEPQVASLRAALISRRVVERLPQHYWRSAVLCVVVAGLYRAIHLRSLRRVACTALVGCVFVDLLLFARPQIPIIPRSHWFPELPSGGDAAAPSPGRARTLFLGEIFPPNAATVYRVPDLRSYDGVEHRGLTRLIQALDPRARTSADALHASRLLHHSWRHRLLALIGVRYLAAAPGRFVPDSDCWRPAGQIGALERFKLTCQPEATLWYVPDDQAAGIDSWRELVTRAAPIDAHVLSSEAASELAVSCTVPSGGILVVPRLYLPGWQMVDGPEGAEVVPVVSALVGVRVPAAGPVRVRLRYRPSLLTAALTGSVAAALTILLLAQGRERERRGRMAATPAGPGQAGAIGRLTTPAGGSPAEP